MLLQVEIKNQIFENKNKIMIKINKNLIVLIYLSFRIYYRDKIDKY